MSRFGRRPTAFFLPLLLLLLHSQPTAPALSDLFFHLAPHQARVPSWRQLKDLAHSVVQFGGQEARVRGRLLCRGGAVQGPVRLELVEDKGELNFEPHALNSTHISSDGSFQFSAGVPPHRPPFRPLLLARASCKHRPVTLIRAVPADAIQNGRVHDFGDLDLAGKL